MTCRHGPNDPECGSHPNHDFYTSESSRLRATCGSREPTTPDSEKYEIIQAERIGSHLVLKVKYPNCASCAFEGIKIMVFLNITETQALMWRKIDPHFRSPEKKLLSKEAPSPAARFPGNKEGWEDAIEYAKKK